MKDLTGQKFSRLTAVRPTEERANGSVVWECRCQCDGKTVFVDAHSLRTGRTQSCGCLRIEKAKESAARRGKTKALDIEGERFGRLTAIRPTEKREGSNVVWECRCDCGNVAFVAADKLRKGHTKSCGCLRRERTVKEKAVPENEAIYLARRPQVKVGQEVVRKPLTIVNTVGHQENQEGRKSMAGKVIFIHPQGRFHTVEFTVNGVTMRENFSGAEV